ncbi:MAG: penicillin-binding protein 1C [Marinagarivorans sp.]|nr:penicillin-binding protein 1C [Marinagarivorans sp.]
MNRLRAFLLAARFLLAATFLTLTLTVFHFWSVNLSFNSPLSPILLSDKGELINAKVAADQQWRLPLMQQLSPHYAAALITYEDEHFYYHPGINPIAIVRALISNIQHKKIISGGSTITMQVARMLRKDQPRTYLNKFIEILLALKLEWHLSKSDILLLYANNAPFGGNIVGISAASQRYFDREAGALSWAEAATLAVLPNSPALIHPGRSRDQLIKKRNRLLQKLRSQNTMTDLEYQLAVLEPIPQKPAPFPKLAKHLFATLIKQTTDKKSLKSTTTLTTTLDANLQRRLEALAKHQSQQLYQQGIHNFAVVIIDNQTMRTVAYLGNSTVNLKNTKQQLVLSGDVDIAQKPRSTGSILKPLLYGLILEGGYLLPETLVPDIPINFNGFSPENYDHSYKGAVPAKIALAQSLNIPAVNMLKIYGIGQFYDALKNMGMSTLFRPADDYGLSLILGGAEGSLWDITAIYARLMASAKANSNNHALATQAIKILKNNSKHKKNADFINDKNAQILSTGAAWLTLEALLEVSRPGNNQWWRDYANSQAIAWKTGTSYGLRDAWAIGSNPRYTVGVWTGNATGEGVAGLSGRVSAAPTLFKIFDMLPTAAWPKKPLYDLKPLVICAQNGYLATDGCKTATTFAPKNSYFQQQSPHHRRILLDQTLQTRVHGGCESAANMHTASAFILPPAIAYYWRQHNTYATLPPWRSDCIKGLAQYTNEQPLDIIYPLEGSKIYLPRGLDGEQQNTIFKARHQDKQQTLFWHFDDTYLGQTRVFHEMAVSLTPGWHKLVVMDEQGFQQMRWVKGLQKP